MKKKIRSALVTVYHKDNLEPILQALIKAGIRLISTGGTQQFIESLGLQVTPVETVTGYPSILGGRVKTLHPKVFGGLLRRDDNASDKKELNDFGIEPIDLVIVDLYPFEDTLRDSIIPGSPLKEAHIIEKIDVGGISLIRAAAKNYQDVLIIPSRNEYGFLFDILESKSGETILEERKLMAAHAFNITSHYDTAIFKYFNKDGGVNSFKESILDSKKLRYGENPHQQGTFYGKFEDLFEQISGKEISYNNLLDIEAAVSLIDDFEEVSCAIIKHNNACGIASSNNLMDVWKKALQADPLSAFGGIIIVNRPVTKEVAEEINKLFFEILIAPSFDGEEAQKILMQKKNRILLERKKMKDSNENKKQFRSLLNGVIEQDKDTKTETAEDLKAVTKIQATSSQIEDMLFANRIVKHTKSNTIVLAKNKQLLASGTGQTSRVDALRQAIHKAKHFGFDLQGAVMSSDAFFPFPDCVEIAHEAGINAVIQPGGSIKDQESIDYCNAHDMVMVTTGFRHFKH